MPYLLYQNILLRQAVFKENFQTLITTKASTRDNETISWRCKRERKSFRNSLKNSFYNLRTGYALFCSESFIYKKPSLCLCFLRDLWLVLHLLFCWPLIPSLLEFFWTFNLWDSKNIVITLKVIIKRWFSFVIFVT